MFLPVPLKIARPQPTRRSIIAAFAGLAAGAGWGKFAVAQPAIEGLPDAADALTQIMPQAAPPVVFHNPAGKRLTLADYRGQALVVNLWATWCGPCVEELPSFAAIAPILRPHGVLILPISIDIGGAADVRPFFASHHIRSLPVLLDPNGNNMGVLGTNAIPYSIIINAAGKMVATMDGAADWNTPRTIAYLEALGSASAPGREARFTPV
ncbi:MAG: TlpA disulfide reductase family protein [Acidocella sp.]|nr:TlpA disulfide reductase family protein [Acidocella sp.]